jgi:hypothetical protein
MTSKLERKWWFQLPVCALAAFLTAYLMDGAGIARPYRFAGWIVYALCLAGLQRGLSLAAWFAVVSMTPSDKVLDRTR